MEKSERFVNSTTTILQGIILIILGILLIIGRNAFVDLVAYGVSLILVMMGITNSIKNIISKSEKVVTTNFIYSILNILTGAFIYFNTSIFVNMFPLLFTIYILIDAIIKSTVFYIYKKNKIPPRFAVLFRSILAYVFFCIMLFYPLIRLNVTYILAGIYVLLLALSYMISGIESTIPIRKINKLKKKIKIALPIFVAAFIPRMALEEINQVFMPYRSNKEIEFKKIDEVPDIEVLVHMKKGLSASFGHVDLYYNGKIISYGSYDESNVLFNSSIGDGVLFECDKDKYLEFCNTKVNKTIVGFGLKLTENQKDAINRKIEEIKKSTYEWYPESYLHKDKEFNDYASMLYNATGAKFYKFIDGKFKTYFVLNTNCVLLADEILGTSGIDILKISGLIAPGTYYEYFNREFKRKNSKVVSKKIYMDKSGILKDKEKTL